MAISMQCQKCFRIQQPYVDSSNDKVYCSSCNEEMNVTIFFKNQLRQTQKGGKTTKSFSIKCTNCSKTDRPILVDGEAVCTTCGKVIDNVSLPFKLALKQFLGG